MKILTYNVNGIRAASKKGLLEFLKDQNADVVCIQETKAQKEQYDRTLFEDLGYKDYWFSAEKKGYSGVLILSRHIPIHVEYGCGHELFDFEGRVIRLDFENLSVFSIYFPSGTTGDIRQDVKYEFLDYIYDYLNDFKTTNPNVVVAGDYNICNKAIDIHNPVSNKNSSGFLPEERSWMDKFFENGFHDSFRLINPDPDHYTWWSYRANARANNKGWRIDYIAISDDLKTSLKSSEILPEFNHSDHCSMFIELS
jgi:exodeoxyribonuclease-3